jgi:hypothetical protein
MNEEDIMDEINYLKRRATMLEKMIARKHEEGGGEEVACCSSSVVKLANDAPTTKGDNSMFSRTSIC